MSTYAKSGKKRRKKSKVKVALTVAGRLGILLLVTILVLCGTAYLTLFKIKNSSEAARNILITTLMESGQLKFVARMVCSKEEIKEIVATNAMQKMEVEQDTNLITVEANEETGDGDGESNEELLRDRIHRDGRRNAGIPGQRRNGCGNGRDRRGRGRRNGSS